MADCKDTIISRREYNDKKPYPMSAMSTNETCPPPISRTTPTRENSYWFAHGSGDETPVNRNNSKDNKDALLQKEREERIRIFREQQEEERIRRAKELENSFELSKKFREQQEEDRRRKLDEARVREIERRQQVEERKRQIWEAEQERKEAILRRNLEREARIEARRNAQRNSMSFAFGSSTPRTFDLDLAALGSSPLGCSLMSSVSSRRSEEKDVGVKRATSACSLDRKAGEDLMSRSMISLSSASRGRRRTDLTPIMPRERSVTPHTVPRGKDGSRSPSRPQSSMSGRSEMSATSSQASSVNLRPRPPPRKPRPVSYAGSTTDRSSLINNTSEKYTKSRESSNASLLGPKPFKPKSSDVDTTISKVHPPVKKPVPPPKSAHVLAKARNHPVPTKDNLRKNAKVAPVEQKKDLPNAPETPDINLLSDGKIESPSSPEISTTDSFTISSRPSEDIEKPEKVPQQPVAEKPMEDETVQPDTSSDVPNSESTQMKPRITSEEEAKAAIAEKRRLAREQAEREAEMERQRQEELRRQEEERRIQEELEQKRLEEEQIRLAELHRKLEEEKLQKAIEEQKQRELEEKAKKEEEARLRMEKEEQERKAREEAEKQRLELEERLRKEEIERAERKKRVEQIMSRTRNKSNAAANKTLPSPANENPSTPVDTPLDSQTTELTKSSNVILSSTLTSATNGNSDIEIQSNNVLSNSTTATPPLNLDILMPHSGIKNGYHSDSVEQSFVKNGSANNCVPNRTPNSDTISPPHTNGYSSHEEMSLTSSPEDKSEKSSNRLLLNLQPPPPPNVVPQEHDNQLIDVGGQMNSSNDSYLIHPDIVNSNLVSSNDPFRAFETTLPKKQETAITDLLS